jgi:hypothetical protein
MFDGIESLKLLRICSVSIFKVSHKKFRNMIYLGRGKTITFFKLTHQIPNDKSMRKRFLDPKEWERWAYYGQQGYKEYDEYSMDQKKFQQLHSKSHKSFFFV